jgi:predicted Rossmann fold flavoprotein
MNGESRPDTRPHDVVVIGGGAAGLWAAAAAARRGSSVLLLEKNARPGVKILASGGGACNLTTSLGAREAAWWFRPRGERFLKAAFHALSPQRLREEFARMGVPTHVEEEMERVWPDSRRARDVLDALIARATGAGVRIATSAAVLGLHRDGDVFAVRTAASTLRARHVVLASGGQSYPRAGATGDGYAWVREMGHTITDLAPALVPLLVDVPWVHELRGIAVPVRARVLDPEGRALIERERPILFTHFGLSGPAAMDVSRFFTLAAPWAAPRLLLDFAPTRAFDTLRADLDRHASERGASGMEEALPAALPERLRAALVGAAGIPPSSPAANVDRAARHRLVETVKSLELRVEGSRGWDFAEVTAGGVDLDEVDPLTMRSRLVENLWLIGEILDLDGPIGGFNFQSAFATAEIAGEAIPAPRPR